MATHRKPCLTILFLWLLGILLAFPVVVLSAPDHSVWDDLLGQYNHQGQVDYAGLKQAEVRLDAYLEALAAINPQSLARDDKFAFYINAYNAWTIKLILTEYPDVASIKDYGNIFKSPWKKKFVTIKGEIVTLDHIEHDILRPSFKDPRVHFAINCAAKSCPPLYREAFVGRRLQSQLDDASRRFINDGRFNRLEGTTLYVSSIFKWFKEDFQDDIVGFFEQHASPELKQAIATQKPLLKLKYLDYDWSLNGK